MGKKNRANKRQKREGSAAKEAAVLVEQEETVKKVEENKKQQQKKEKKQKQQKQKRPVEEEENKEDAQEEARQPMEEEADEDDHKQVQPNDDGDGDGDGEGDIEKEVEEETGGRGNDDDGDENVITSQPPAQAKPEPPFVSDGKYRNKQRCLLLSSRGITARYRHLMEDLRTLIPHHKKDSKLDAGDEGPGNAVNAIAEMRSCNTVLFLECRKRQDAYMWMGRVGATAGPSARFHVTNIHTMDELRLTGNCMKGSRPVLSFDQAFDNFAHLRLLKALFVDVFGTPRGHPKSKPFVDRVMAFYHADNKVRALTCLPSYAVCLLPFARAREDEMMLRNDGTECR